MASKDKDYRLVSLIVDICPLPCRKLFESKAKSDLSVSYTTLDDYMAKRYDDVQNLIHKKYIRSDALIFPKADTEKWDVSLLSGLLNGLFKIQLAIDEISSILTIKDIRNELQHKTGSDVIEDSEFDEIWSAIESATLTLANIVGGVPYESEIKHLIDDVKINNLPRLGDTLKLWYEDIIVQLRNEIADIKETSQESHDILRRVTVYRRLPEGGKSKRMKTESQILNNMRGQFAMTLKREKSDDFKPSDEDISKIRTKLRDNHFVVVSGYENTSYLATALSAVEQADYDINRCVEMKSVDHWIHIDPKETDLVLFCEPIQQNPETFSPEKEKHMIDTFRGMLEAAKMDDRDSRIDVVIVSEHSLISKWKTKHDDELFEDMVVLNKPTDETAPLDLIKSNVADRKGSKEDVLGNMIAYSELYIQQLRSATVDQSLLEAAKSKFRAHKAILITGPKGSGRTSFAVKLLASLYEENQCVVLTETSEWKHVILGRVSVIIIDEFAGKFRYDASTAESWLKKFDLIYAAVAQGKLNVIVTCESSKFSKVLKNLSGHALLDNRINLTNRGIQNIKVEPASPRMEEHTDTEMDVLEDTDSSNSNFRADSNKCKKGINKNLDLGTLKYFGEFMVENDAHVVLIDACEMDDGSIACVWNNQTVKLYECDNFTMVLETKLEKSANCLCCGNKSCLIIGFNSYVQQAPVSDNKVKLGDLVQVNHICNKMTASESEIYISSTSVVFVYDYNWTQLYQISYTNGVRLFQDIRDMFLDIEKSRLYISDWKIGLSVIDNGKSCKRLVTYLKNQKCLTNGYGSELLVIGEKYAEHRIIVFDRDTEMVQGTLLEIVDKDIKKIMFSAEKRRLTTVTDNTQKPFRVYTRTLPTFDK